MQTAHHRLVTHAVADRSGPRSCIPGLPGPKRLAALVTLGALAACAPLGVVGDGSTVSGGQPNRGWLLDGARLPDRGDGFITPPTWRGRGLRYGTDELVGLVSDAARAIRLDNAPIRLGVADLSPPGGGPAAPYHRSHQNGRDIDLLLYLRDAAGKPVEPTAMRALGDDGAARDGSRFSLDVARTWRLVRALVTSPGHEVQYIFLYEPLTQLLLDHARASGEPPWLWELARLALLEPTGAPHDDHLHVRVFCSREDAAVGCTDFGNLALFDKRRRAALHLRGVLEQGARALGRSTAAVLAWAPALVPSSRASQRRRAAAHAS